MDWIIIQLSVAFNAVCITAIITQYFTIYKLKNTKIMTAEFKEAIDKLNQATEMVKNRMSEISSAMEGSISSIDAKDALDAINGATEALNAIGNPQPEQTA